LGDGEGLAAGEVGDEDGLRRHCCGGGGGRGRDGWCLVYDLGRLRLIEVCFMMWKKAGFDSVSTSSTTMP
jgi:hypothetical protein